MGNKQHFKTLNLDVQGMHCTNCEVLIERRFKNIPGVRSVHVSHRRGSAEIRYTGNLDIGALQSALKEDGYRVFRRAGKSSALADQDSRNSRRDRAEIGAVFLILVAGYFVLQRFDVLPDRLVIPNTISYGLAFAIGVVASLSTCMAVTGGLLVAVAAKYNAASSGLTGAQKFKPHLYFNAGRIISYAVLGGAIGALGSSFALSPEVNGLLVILASIIMVALGLQMLKLMPSFGALQPRMPKFIAHKIHNFSEREAKGGAFVLGAFTFFLPCGFTQALQLYVLAKGSPQVGALVMLAFALGTLPALLSLSALSSFAAGFVQRYFLKVAGVAVVVLGILNVQSGLTLSALGTVDSTASPGSAGQVSQSDIPAVPIVDGNQIVNMKVVGYTYQPNHFAVVAGVPVEWRIDGQQAVRCGRFLIAPRAGVRQILSSTDTTVITFTPKAPGEISFNCGMGMMTRGSKFIVRANEPSAAATTAPAPTSNEASALSSDQRSAIERITKDYLLQHPEVIQEAFAELEKRQQSAEVDQHRTAVRENAATIFSSPRQVVLGNRQGDVTMVEFFDYNCGYCKRALSDMISLLQTDPKLKVVLKEFPVLGDASVEAAKVAVAVRMQDETGAKYLEFHQKLLGGRGQADRARALAVANELGLDMARLDRDMASPEVKATIDENLKLAQALGVNGTPSYVVGDQVVIGAVGLDALKEKLRVARQ